MKPNYCSGGSFVSGGRFSSFRSSSSRSKSTGSLLQKQPTLNNVSGNGCPSSSSLSSTASTTISSSSSPFIVYRSAKYVQPHARALQTLRSYAKYYVLAPAVLVANRCKDVIYQICGLLMLLVTSPLWILMIIGLFIVRRLRYILFRKLYPSVVQLEHYDSYSSSSSCPDSPGIVNSIIWTKGKLDAQTIQSRFQLLFSENPQMYDLLRLRLSSRLGTKVWESCANFSLENHIVEAPKRFQNCPIVDEPLGSNKTILQKYVSYWISTPLDESSPPWKIHVISYISREDGLKEKSCLVIRMHAALLKHREVQGGLRELFLECSQTASPGECEIPAQSTPAKVELASPHKSDEDWSVIKVWERLKTKMRLVQITLNKMGSTQQKSFTVWLNLRLKQLEFHSKTAVISLILLDAKDSILQLLSRLEVLLASVLATIVCQVGNLFTRLQAFAAMPMIILVSLLRGSSRSRLESVGLRRNLTPGKRLISWSDLLHGDLVDEICGKVGGGLTPESVMMMACTSALNYYYQMNNISPPKKIGFTLGSTCNPLSQMNPTKAIYLPGNLKACPNAMAHKLKDVEERSQNYPEWRILGVLYMLQYLSLLLPTYLSRKVQNSILSCHPFSFTLADLRTVGGSENVCDPNCIRQLYGEVVEDFTFWPLPPMSDLGVSITLARYTGKMRLFVMSPFQSMDTTLTNRCNQYLIKLAEEVGVERCKIPYSRRTSPQSTSCSTPQPFINRIDNLSMVGPKRSLSVTNANVSTA